MWSACVSRQNVPTVKESEQILKGVLAAAIPGETRKRPQNDDRQGSNIESAERPPTLQEGDPFALSEANPPADLLQLFAETWTWCP